MDSLDRIYLGKFLHSLLPYYTRQYDKVDRGNDAIRSEFQTFSLFNFLNRSFRLISFFLLIRK